MANIKFSQLPNLGTITPSTTVPVVDSLTNYTVTAANLQAYVNNTTGNIAGGNIGTTGQITATGNITGSNVVATANVVAAGNVSGTYILGNGSLLTGLPATYGNANVAAYLATYTGNLSAGNATVTANIATGGINTDNYRYANGTPISFAGTYGDSNVASYLPTYTGGMAAMTGAVATTANISGAYFIGNGSALTGITASGSNSFSTVSVNGTNIVADSPTDTLTIAAGTNISVTGNAASDTVTIGVTGTVANATYATSAGSATTATSALTATSATTATTAGTVTSASQPAITSVGTLTGLTVSGNITGGNISGNGSTMTGIVTSIIAGAGISVNQATGAVTVTNTGSGGTPTTIVSNNNYANTAFGSGKLVINGGNANANSAVVSAAPANSVLMFNDVGNGYIRLDATGNIHIQTINAAGVYTHILRPMLVNFVDFTDNNLPGGNANIAGSTINWGRGTIANFNGALRVPSYTVANKPTSGRAVGDIIAISDSPTNNGRMAYYCTNNVRWQYIDTNGAV